MKLLFTNYLGQTRDFEKRWMKPNTSSLYYLAINNVFCDLRNLPDF